MGLALDEPREDDQCFERGGVSFLVGSELSHWLKFRSPITLDYDVANDGFKLGMGMGSYDCC
ncbi:MAG: hypothetical protein DRI90_15255 [Deltaproteobacteria bacterium]|nr:MAG: hypothetical protein DRI90_15255 [Deltaproteobacteria bacterium]